MKQFNLSTHWQVKQHDPSRDPSTEAQSTDDWLPANVPGSIHQDLIRAGRIPDPFFGLNEKDVQWVGEADWLYRCAFEVPAAMLDAEHVDLCFDGLDTFATVWLNGEVILTSDNMFVPARVPVNTLLKASGNVLCIHFESAVHQGRALEVHYGQGVLWNGETSRLYVRKAQYHYGWDWGPCLLTAGIWRSVRLEAYTARIGEVHAPAEISPDLQQAVLPIEIALVDPPDGAVLDIHLFNAQGETVAEASLPVSEPNVRHMLTIAQPELWYPRGYGGQPRYRLIATLRDGDMTLDTHELRIGLRRLQLVQEPLADEPGTTFYFEVNNIPLFCGGANWIPADSFTPRITAEQYRAWLQLAADANMLMLRVWGGGIYEEDVFYDTCDELGLLVWQDFMFACGMYPAHDKFLASVRAEAEANVMRLRHHACIALWCGNNEDYQVAESLNVYDPAFNRNFILTPFPAREIYERLLPKICKALDPIHPYWRGSPYGGVSVHAQTVGDRHSWDVWHGKMADYRDYPQYSGRFVSEFGMQAAPALTTIESCTLPEDRDVHGPVMRHHNKATDGPERLDHYLSIKFLEPTNLDEYIYATQFLQSEALAAGIDGWRRRWAGPGHYATAGALIWQLNDCWPVISWALADYYRRPKPAYYRVRRTLAPIALGIAPTADDLAIWAVNGTLKAVEASLDIQVIGFDGTFLVHETNHVTLPPLQSTELGSYLSKYNQDGSVVISARLFQGGTVIARATHWPEPHQYLTYPDPGLQVTFQGENIFTVSVQRPARGVYFAAPGATNWSDNMIDLLPGDDQIIHAVGISDQITVRWFTAAVSLTVTSKKP